MEFMTELFVLTSSVLTMTFAAMPFLKKSKVSQNDSPRITSKNINEVM